jgi:hypothetical protein
MTGTPKAVAGITVESAIATSELFIFPEIVFKPEMKRLFSCIFLQDFSGVFELILKAVQGSNSLRSSSLMTM